MLTPPNNFDVYINYIKDDFRIVENRTVLEIGGFHGEHSKMILEHNPLSLTIIEPNLTAYKKLKEKFPNLTILKEDVYDTLYRKEKFDVVVCCGVLYHFHSPLYLLELMTNNAQPTYFICDTYIGSDNFVDEYTNSIGNRIVLDNNKFVKKSFLPSKETLVQSLEDLGYSLIKYVNLQNLKDLNIHTAKRNAQYMIFKKSESK